MRLTMRERHGVVNATAKRYQHSTKKARGQILDEFTKLTRYGRRYAAWLLTNWRRRRVLTIGGVRTVYTFGLKKARKGRIVPKRPRTYGADLQRLLIQLWALSGGLCGKRLAPFIRQTLPVLQRFEEISLKAEQRTKLLAISPATIDRLLVAERKKYRIKGRPTTRPGSLLKHQIPIRTFADWDDAKPGFVEIDLVAHDGGFPASEVIHSLTLTDVATGWTEARALKTKARRWVLEALADITAQLPFTLLGITSDNGGEFINEELLAYCKEHHLTFTRTRPYRKNDNCFVEQKNYTMVRYAVGYARLTTEDHLNCLKKLYPTFGLFTNYFLPSVKLRKKTRTGSKVTKSYDTPQTPLQRMLLHRIISPTAKARLHHQYRLLNPAQLRREITQDQNRLSSLCDSTHIQKTRRKTKYLDSIYQ
ncbi:MAG: putative transposase for insertion sequence element [Bacteroidetes bacterium]|jgi:hypothetical protein|nr:putative transposase for insertion sequence element [Bacteroidota bacterium]